MNPKKLLLPAPKKRSFLLPLLFGTLLFRHEPAASQASPVTTSVTTPVRVGKQVVQVKARNSNSHVNTSLVRHTNATQTDMTAGYWYSSREDNEYCLQFKGNRSSSHWNMSRCLATSVFQKKEENVFQMTKEAGTLQLTGNLDAEVGQGKYTFTEDASFKKYLTDNNITSNDPNFLFHLFFGEVNRAYVSFLKKQYQEVSDERLLELAIHGVSLENYQGYVSLFQKHSHKVPSIQEVVAAKIHGLTEAYVQELQHLGYGELSLPKLTEAKIHGVNAAYVEGLTKAGFGKLPLDKVIAAKIHGVQPATATEMRALGLGELNLDKMISLQIHGVKAAYISDLKASGFDNLTVDQILEAKIRGLNPAAVKEIKALGYQDLTFRDLISAQIHGVNVAYVEDLKKAGLQNLTMDKTIEAKIHGVDGKFIKQAREQGYNLSSIDKYISLKIHGLAMESLKN